MCTQRLECAAHVSFIGHIWKVVFTDVTDIIIFLNSCDSLTCERRPREASQADEKHGEPHGVVDPFGSQKINLREQQNFSLTGLEAGNLRVPLNLCENGIKTIFIDKR